MELGATDVMIGAPAPVATPAVSTPSPLRWFVEGVRTLLFMRPRWLNVHASPAVLAFLVLAELALSVGMDRLFRSGEFDFNWRATLSGWAAFALVAWACYVMRPAAASSEDHSLAPGAAWLLSMTIAQNFALTLLVSLALGPFAHFGMLDTAPYWVQMLLWAGPPLWLLAATIVLLIRAGSPTLLRVVGVLCALAGAVALTRVVAPPPDFWIERRAETPEYESIKFTQERIEHQAPLLNGKLLGLAPQRPGVADMYTLTFAPYEGEEVFRRESRMVSEVMAKRFDAAGRGVQLLNHREHLDDMPWATPLNLRRAIIGISRTMDREEDVLFIHLTSHGAADGELATSFWPLEVDPVMPSDLKKWLDEAGIKHRLISISACYSGSWITPLAGDDTLVMTAADADHTSYGCGKKSELTFFGRAMYDEQIRSKTRDFVAAHAASRKVIEQREKEAGKDDGYSNPQIKAGSRIVPYLAQMRRRLE